MASMDFNARPVPVQQNPYTTDFQNLGLPKFAAELKHSLDIDRVSLAKTMVKISSDMSKGMTPFVSNDIPRIVNILLSLSDDLLDMLIRNELHLLIKYPQNLSLRAPSQFVVTNENDKERPRCYASIHCSQNGTPPSKRQYLATIAQMEDYVREPAIPMLWATLDILAESIDRHSPMGRDWNGECRGEALLRWTTDNGVAIPHPRRYARNDSQRNQIKEWIFEMKRRLNKISNLDDPLPWSMVYIGWTRNEKGRSIEHEKHQGAASPVKFLVEAVMALKIAPTKGFLMRFVPLLAIVDPGDIGVAEHSLSVLAGSYTWWGGLNGSMGGSGGVVTTAMNNGRDETWEEACKQTIAQGVYAENFANLQNTLEERQFLEKYMQPGSELEELRVLERSRDEAKADRDKAAVEYGELVGRWADVKKKRLELEFPEEKQAKALATRKLTEQMKSRFAKRVE